MISLDQEQDCIHFGLINLFNNDQTELIRN